MFMLCIYIYIYIYVYVYICNPNIYICLCVSVWICVYIHTSILQTSSDYPAPDILAIPLERHFFEMLGQPALSG